MGGQCGEFTRSKIDTEQKQMGGGGGEVNSERMRRRSVRRSSPEARDRYRGGARKDEAKEGGEARGNRG